MGRPKKTDPRERPAYARLSIREWDLFERLLGDRQREVRQATGDPSVELSQSDVIRWLILREAQARGLDHSGGPRTAQSAPTPVQYPRSEPPQLRVTEAAPLPYQRHDPAPGERYVERDEEPRPAAKRRR